METPVSSIISTGDLGGQKVKMSFDENSLAHLMSVLTDLYSDPQLAVIREYSTNALDSHIEAGNPDPIQIVTPSALSPYFKIIDRGVGLSVDDITDMYSKYGASTKRGTNDQVGMLGIGAKSALTLVPQFNLTSVKNGVKIFVSVSRASDGSGQMEIIDTKATDEPNGVEISIPIPRNHSFAQKCKDFFRFWKPGTVLVDGKEPEHITGRPVGEKFIINRELNQDYIVMGNVAYPVKESLYEGGYSYSQLGIVAFVEIGDVNFTPSREQLHYTNKTKETIQRIRREFGAELVQSANKDIATAVDHAEAWTRAREWNSNFRGRLGQLTYKGVSIPSDVELASDGKEFSLSAGRQSRYSNWVRSVNPTMTTSYLFVTGFAESLKMSPVQREKAAIYCTQNNLSFNKIVIFKGADVVKKAEHKPFVENMHVVDWSVISQIKVARNVTTNRVMRTDPYDLYDGSYGSTQIRTMDTSKPIIYFSTAELQYPSWLNEMFKDGQIIILSKNRWEKFKRDFPTAQHWRDAVQAEQAKLVVKLTDSDRILWHYQGYRWTIKNLDAIKIDDPDLHLFVKVLSVHNPQFSDAATKLKGIQRRDLPQIVVEVPNNPLTKYPLLGNINGVDDREHIYWYLNTYYATMTTNNEEN